MIVRRQRYSHSGHAGFTLVEVLLALSISILLLAMAVSTLWAYGQLYTQEFQRPRYDRHAANLARSLEALFQSAEPENDETEAVVSWTHLPGESTREEPRLSLLYAGTNPLLSTDEGRPGLVRVHLHFEEGEGLYLLWHKSPKDARDKPDIFASLLSPHIVAVTPWYYDEEKEEWEDNADFLDSGSRDEERPLPRYVELTFQWPDRPQKEQQVKNLFFLPTADSEQLTF